jgi:flagellar basal body-associated protein FliL
MGGGYPGGPAPLPPRKSKKGLIITLISVGAALIIAAVFIILYFTLWTLYIKNSQYLQPVRW